MRLSFYSSFDKNKIHQLWFIAENVAVAGVLFYTMLIFGRIVPCYLDTSIFIVLSRLLALFCRLAEASFCWTTWNWMGALVSSRFFSGRLSRLSGFSTCLYAIGILLSAGILAVLKEKVRRLVSANHEEIWQKRQTRGI